MLDMQGLTNRSRPMAWFWPAVAVAAAAVVSVAVMIVQWGGCNPAGLGAAQLWGVLDTSAQPSVSKEIQGTDFVVVARAALQFTGPDMCSCFGTRFAAPNAGLPG
jgi:hypothetical protein